MAGVVDDGMIDLVSMDAEGVWALHMVEDRPWVGDADQYDQLRRKFNLYASYILDGELGVSFPKSVGRRVRIVLDCFHAPDREALDLVAIARQSLKEFGIEMSITMRH